MKKTSILKNKTIIIGIGRLGSAIANKCSSEGKNLIVIDSNKDAFDRLDENFSGYTIVGDTTDFTVLESAYIKTAKEVIITTGDDNVNIYLAYVARKVFEVPNVYLRLDAPENEILLKGLGVKAIYPQDLSYDKFNLMRGGR